jgi:hypothetical protein
MTEILALLVARSKRRRRRICGLLACLDAALAALADRLDAIDCRQEVARAG